MTRELYLTPAHVHSLTPGKREYTIRDLGCPGLGLRVQPSGSKSWIRFRRSEGKTRRVTLGSWPRMTIEAARVAFHLCETEPVASTDTARSTRRFGKTLTFAELTDRFHLEHGPKQKISTRVARKSYLNTQLLPEFGTRQLGQIAPKEIAQWFHAYSHNRPGGANEALALFTTILNWGKARGYLPQPLPNPAAPVRKNKRKARGQMLSFSQIQDLAGMLRLADGRNWLPAQAIRLILLTGCRKKEILSLHWSDVKRNRLALRDSKTGPRDVFLGETAREAFQDLKRTTGNSAFVFPSRRSKSGHIMGVAGTWKTLRKYAGLPKDLRIHDLRHTYASHAILAGESLPTTGRLLGHSSPRSTKRYAHLDGTSLIPAANTISRQIAKLMTVD